MKIWIVSIKTEARPLVKVFDNASEAWECFGAACDDGDEAYIDESVLYSVYTVEEDEE